MSFSRRGRRGAPVDLPLRQAEAPGGRRSRRRRAGEATMAKFATCCAPALAAVLLAAGSAAAQVEVVGGTQATACAQAAKDGLSGPQYEKICTQSIENELLVPLDRAGTYVNRGIIKMRGKAYADAIKDFDTAIKYQSNLAEAYVNRAAARIGAHQFRDSLADTQNALMLGVKEPQKAYYNRGLANEWLDDYEAAYADYQKALALAPDWQLVKDQLARFSVNHAQSAL